MNEKIIVNGYELDSEQSKVVYSESKNSLVIAGAGSGKSFTIVGKIKYLTTVKNIRFNEILCVSFTNDSCLSLMNNLIKNDCKVEVLTFHKLALKILKLNNIKVNITPSDYLEYIIHEYFCSLIYVDSFYIKIVLKYYKIKFNDKDYFTKYNDLVKNGNISILEKLISTFIHLFKSGGKNYNYLLEILNDELKFFKKIVSSKNIYFIILVVKILNEYNIELNSTNSIDFDDMIKIATEILKDTSYKFKYRYIIIDEFQDTSILRYNLINELLKKTNAYFLAVGDDYQSIYRFTGCDLYLFLNFSDFFENSSIYKIQNTYRNSVELISLAGYFVQKNKSQIPKKLKSNKNLNLPIKILYYKNESNVFIKLLDYLYKHNKRKVLILGRNNKNINDVINESFIVDDKGIIEYKKYKHMNIRYLTVHKSKGLEEEIVIVLSLEDDIWGFPNKKVDDKILNYVLPGKEKYLYSEERRLFYVALTRTKNEVYLLVNKNKPSIFIKELITDSKKYVEVLELW